MKTTWGLYLKRTRTCRAMPMVSRVWSASSPNWPEREFPSPLGVAKINGDDRPKAMELGWLVGFWDEFLFLMYYLSWMRELHSVYTAYQHFLLFLCFKLFLIETGVHTLVADILCHYYICLWQFRPLERWFECMFEMLLGHLG